MTRPSPGAARVPIASMLALLAAGSRAAPPSDGGAGVAFSVARRVPGGESQRQPIITMSEGWACAAFGSEHGIHQCWDAGPSPHAWTVPWMKDRIDVASDHWCEHDLSLQTLRCWQRPRRGDAGPRATPARSQSSPVPAREQGAGRVVPQPRDPRIGRGIISPGSDASACAARGDLVVCWGEKYSPPATPNQPVPVFFEPLPPGDLAIIDGPDATAGKANCQVQRSCANPARQIPPCEGDSDTGRPVAEILAKTNSLSGGIVRVRGALGVGPLYPAPYVADVAMQHKRVCDPAVSCCEVRWSPVLVGGAGGALSIEDLSCYGYASRACCNAPAHGQTVIATGRLVRERPYMTTVGWRLVNASLCAAN